MQLHEDRFRFDWDKRLIKGLNHLAVNSKDQVQFIRGSCEYRLELIAVSLRIIETAVTAIVNVLFFIETD